jgi:DNA polymerase-3 subunit epsilon
LIDPQQLPLLYKEITPKQTTINLTVCNNSGADANENRRLNQDRKKLKIITATVDETEAHKERLDVVKQKGGEPLWKLPSY